MLVQLVPFNFDSKHGSDPLKSTPRIKYSGKNLCLNGPLKIGMLAFQSTPKKLLDQTKETILITALEKIHITGVNSKWIFWEANGRFCIFGKNFPNRLSKIKQRVCNLIFDILSELCVQILKNHENKPKRPLPCFHVP